ncbi:MAG: 23S rRNA (adenine(2503)-C(2))-methyltransferase RlmN [Candidatus Mcinerneyibacterium aminivorans]|uniref:23S rRNA (Adenine(2503)-C(2))-methyltransferase RlmN n=1 Tax=Candidatus Mcinerneyibacterium aminivorans TaxID=2703815 RepID=A0A5D0MF03_9BACT|nr:MAG: 23S rRNA (adenine(2503)-C(2))-methyltransferase RlmN [Candidatus Mcinerneyibacterium aminivorans]
MNVKNIFDLDKSDLKNYFKKDFRYDQIFSWVLDRNVYDFKKMTNLPKSLRKELDKSLGIINLQKEKVEVSKDSNTEKYLFKTEDGSYIESVYMRYENRNTACISTQIGCKRKCKFCATGAVGYKRNLKPSEILSQILFLPDVTNIVFMGMGEPLDNYDNLVRALNFINDEIYMNMGARRITISTIGIPSKVKQLAKLKKQFGLSWSLHTTMNDLRKKLMPSTRNYGIDDLLNSFKYYKDETNADITIEFILIKNINMNRKEATNLYKISKKLNAKINFIPYNEHRYANYKKPNKTEINNFVKFFQDKGVFYSIRDSKGQNISAACGQLSGKTKEA